MKKMITTIILGIALSVPFITAAGPTLPWASVEEIEDYGTGFLVKGPDYSSNPASCSSTRYGRVNPNLPADQMEQLNKLILSAFLSGHQIRVKIDSSVCAGDYPAIYAVRINRDK